MLGPQKFYIWLIQVLLLFFLICILLWVSLTPKKPTYAVVSMEIPALRRQRATQRGGGESNTTVSLELEIENPNEKMGIYYDDTRITLSHGDRSLGSTSIPRFYQRRREKITEKLHVDVREGVWGAAGFNGTVELRVALATKVRYRSLGVKSRKRKMEVEGRVLVGSDGKISGKTKRVELLRSPKKRKYSRSRAIDGHWS